MFIGMSMGKSEKLTLKRGRIKNAYKGLMYCKSIFLVSISK